MSRKILVTGSIAYDILLAYDGSFSDAIDPNALEKLNLSFFSPHYAKHHGGTGANMAWNLKLLGSDPVLVGAVGNDGGAYLEILKKHSVPTENIQVVEDAVTATAIICTDSREHQIAFFHPGADEFSPWPKLNLQGVGYAVVGPRDITAMVDAMEWCEEHQIPVLFDPGQQVIAFGDDELERLVEMSTVLIANEYEWNRIHHKLKCGEDAILKNVSIVIVTYGDHGFTVFDENGATAIRACPPKQLVNPTGAGDAFRAGLLVGLNNSWDIFDAGRLGASVSSFVVEQEGTLMDSLDLDSVRKRIEQVYEKELPVF